MGQREVEQHPDVQVVQAVEGPSAATPHGDDTVRPQQAQCVADGALRLTTSGGEVADTGLAVEQHAEQTQSAGIGQQAEDPAHVKDVVLRRQPVTGTPHTFGVVNPAAACIRYDV